MNYELRRMDNEGMKGRRDEGDNYFSLVYSPWDLVTSNRIVSYHILSYHIMSLIFIRGRG